MEVRDSGNNVVEFIGSSFLTHGLACLKIFAFICIILSCFPATIYVHTSFKCGLASFSLPLNLYSRSILMEVPRSELLNKLVYFYIPRGRSERVSLCLQWSGAINKAVAPNLPLANFSWGFVPSV